MIKLILLLSILILFPIIIKSKIEAIELPITAIYIMELIVLLSIWTIISMIFTYYDLQFNKAVKLFTIIVVFLFLLLFIMLIRSSKKISFDYFIIDEIKKYKFEFVLMCIIIGYHIFRCLYFQTIAYSDSKTYIPIINDIIDTNRFFLLNNSNGEAITNSNVISKKYLLSSWYSFEATISYIFGIHPLIVVNTILPPIIIALSYMSFWLLSEIIFEKEYNKRFIMLFTIGLIFQFMDNDPAMYFMIWPTWGKNIVMSITLPLLIYFYKSNLNYIRKVIYMALTCLVASFSSTIGVIIMPVLYMSLMIDKCINNKSINIKDVVSSMIFGVPLIGYFCLYMLW